MFPTTFNDVILQAETHGLYQKLVRQLNKDFLYANIDLDFSEDILPSSLKVLLHETVFKLICEKFAEYLNLLYIIDVSEEKIKKLNSNDPVKLAEEVTFLILLREWKKVWFREQYG